MDMWNSPASTRCRKLSYLCLSNRSCAAPPTKMSISVNSSPSPDCSQSFLRDSAIEALRLMPEKK